MARSPFAKRAALAAALAAGSLALSGCSGGGALPTVLYLAIATNPDQTIDGELLQGYRQRLGLLETNYQQLHPSTQFQFSLYSRDRIIAAMRLRNRAGTGPDLLLVNGETAVALLKEGLTDPFPATPAQLKPFPREELVRLRDHRGRLAGIPLMIQTQLACFNRTRLKQSPPSLQALLDASAGGHPVGLSVDLHDLIWSAGSLGALEGLNQAVAGQTLSAPARQGLERWLAWLQSANALQKLTFYPNYESAESDFLAGRLDWIPCPSPGLSKLRKRLGKALGVATLPRGNWGEPSPLNRLRVFALGRNSSAAGRERALAFSDFSINPLSQRKLSLGSQSVLPANQYVGVSVSGSESMAAMVSSARQGQQTNAISMVLQNDQARITQAQNELIELVFGVDNPNSTVNDLVRVLRPRR